MRESGYGVNSVTVGSTELLLTAVGGGSAVHLTPPAGQGDSGQAAVPDYFYEPEAAARRPALAGYDRDVLLAPRWSERTLCGRPWAVMVGGDGGSISAWGEDPEFAPTCKRCLLLMDRMFPPPSLHPRLPVVARVGADVVAEHGYAEVCGVPGDQQAELRRQLRSLVRAATGHPCRTYVRGSTVFAVWEPIAELHYDEELSAAADAVEAVLFGKAPRPRAEPEWRLMWSTWATD